MTGFHESSLFGLVSFFVIYKYENGYGVWLRGIWDMIRRRMTPLLHNSKILAFESVMSSILM